jgi:hypothetical protein
MSPLSVQDGFTPNANANIGLGGNDPTRDEADVAAMTDADPNSVDIFFVDRIALAGSFDPGGVAYNTGWNFVTNQDGSRNKAFQNFMVVQGVPQAQGRGHVVAHEMMHLLLNQGHRTNEPTVALFNTRDNDQSGIFVSKRIGPFVIDGAIGSDDTFRIRDVAENLPQL